MGTNELQWLNDAKIWLDANWAMIMLVLTYVIQVIVNIKNRVSVITSRFSANLAQNENTTLTSTLNAVAKALTETKQELANVKAELLEVKTNELANSNMIGLMVEGSNLTRERKIAISKIHDSVVENGKKSVRSLTDNFYKAVEDANSIKNNFELLKSRPLEVITTTKSALDEIKKEVKDVKEVFSKDEPSRFL